LNAVSFATDLIFLDALLASTLSNVIPVPDYNIAPTM
jgi:hypothetical protein